MKSFSISSGNYLLPVHVGAPDYKKILYLNIFLFNSIINIFFKFTNVSKNNKNLSSNLSYDSNTFLKSKGSYLAGLLEGDGHIGLPKVVNGKTVYPYIAITFLNKDLPLLNKLVDIFGGRIRFKNKENTIVWIISNHNDLIKFINIINGYLRTPKIIRFNEIIQWLNKKYNYNIHINSIDVHSLAENGWLAGFIDADGHFKIRYTEKQLDQHSNKILTKERIEVRFVLELRKSIGSNDNESYKPIMSQINLFLNINNNIKESKHNVDKTYWIIEVFSLTKLDVLINYLKIYPLFTIKRNDFEDWLKVYYLIVDKKHLTEEGKMLIKSIKSNMNKKREIFNWNHLIFLNEK